MWLPTLSYASKDSYHADWCAVNGEAVPGDVPVEVTVLSVDVPDVNDHEFLLEINEGCPQNAGSVGVRVVEVWRQYRAELATTHLSIPCASLEVVKINGYLLSASLALGASHTRA